MTLPSSMTLRKPIPLTEVFFYLFAFNFPISIPGFSFWFLLIQLQLNLLVFRLLRFKFMKFETFSVMLVNDFSSLKSHILVWFLVLVLVLSPSNQVSSIIHESYELEAHCPNKQVLVEPTYVICLVLSAYMFYLVVILRSLIH